MAEFLSVEFRPQRDCWWPELQQLVWLAADMGKRCSDCVLPSSVLAQSVMPFLVPPTMHWRVSAADFKRQSGATSRQKPQWSQVISAELYRLGSEIPPFEIFAKQVSVDDNCILVMYAIRHTSLDGDWNMTRSQLQLVPTHRRTVSSGVITFEGSVGKTHGTTDLWASDIRLCRNKLGTLHGTFATIDSIGQGKRFKWYTFPHFEGHFLDPDSIHISEALGRHCVELTRVCHSSKPCCSSDRG
ncbi:hypothetical protein AK812_SmicGene49048 [Symbiodinium microadriaticum]|uniref:Uncharacterized protein n=1 Tax=Symbiodinium microadriaticum TaxID=2951 RepID=A0A1Q9CU99_SYMMI|nr:hypothetical protein AK812_SmicGene49048 [Symbiodinium microadriaticum]